MTHFGLLCPPVAGHLNPTLALAQALVERGHQATWFGPDVARERVESEGIGYRDFGPAILAMPPPPHHSAHRVGWGGLRQTNARWQWNSGVVVRCAPAAMQAAGVEAVVADQMEFGASTVATLLKRPLITLCNALPLHWSEEAPPAYLPWAPGTPRPLNRLAVWLQDWDMGRVLAAINQARQEWGLGPLGHLRETQSTVLTLSQQPAGFDFPRPGSGLTYVGPLFGGYRSPAPFPLERLNGKPLVYISMGTYYNTDRASFDGLLAACRGLDVQLVVSLGLGAALGQSPADAIVLPFVPQDVVLSRARLMISNGGTNTVLEALRHGVPMVLLPRVLDQFGAAARVRRRGAGQMVLGRPGVPVLARAIRTVLEDAAYRQAAAALAIEIREAGGVQAAADRVEAALADG